MRVRRYLAKAGLPDDPKKERPLKIVIPARAESAALPETVTRLAALPGAERAEIFAVVNNADGERGEAFDDNQKTIGLLRALKIDGLEIVDRSSPGRGLPEKIAGVGAARKAGLDRALCACPPDGALAFLDADCRVSDDYVGALLAWSASGGARVAVLAYEHDLPPGEPRRTAAALYELRLRYVEAMLRAIPTIYAFSTIGSTIVCTPEGYAAAGGMNTRKATEDFYFLQSAAKAGGVERLERPIVYPSARLSDRVYLGTGHGIGKIVEASLEMRLEHPDTYAVAGRALQAVLDAFDREPELPAEFARFLSEKGMERLLRSARDGARTPDAFRRRVHEWFDALMIRQAVHFLRDNVYGELPWRDALDRAGLADLARRVPRG